MYQRQASKGSYVFLGILFLVLLGIIGFLYRQQLGVVFRGLEPSCVIGLATASITVQSWSANDDCQAMLAGQDNFTGRNWAKLDATQISSGEGTIMCEMDIQDRHLIVRDTTPESGNGNITCGILQGTVPSGVLPQ